MFFLCYSVIVSDVLKIRTSWEYKKLRVFFLLFIIIYLDGV